MDLQTMVAWGKAGAAAAIAWGAVGSALGTGTAGMAAIGAWKKCYAQSKAAPFILVTFIGAPLSQTIYGMILMNAMVRICDDALAAGGDAFLNWPAMLSAGIFGGIWQNRQVIFDIFKFNVSIELLKRRSCVSAFYGCVTSHQNLGAFLDNKILPARLIQAAF